MTHQFNSTKAFLCCLITIVLANCQIANAASDSAIAKNISYRINGKAFSTLSSVKQSDSVTVIFTTDTGTSPTLFSLVTYKAPDSVYTEQTANQQMIFDTMSVICYPGSHKLSVVLSGCFYQLDFVKGTAIIQLGPAGTNNFYSEQNRLIASSNGGKETCLNNNPLPVELISFTASRNGDAIALNWSTASEINNSYFDLERSINGGEFVSIGQVEGHGNSVLIENYSFSDINSPAGTLVYKLKQVDFNGNAGYSNAIEVKSINVVAYTAKAWFTQSDGNVNITVEGSEGAESNLSITDIQGRLITHMNTITNGSASTVSINMNGYGNGMYNVTIWDNANIQTVRFIKN